MKTRSIQIRPDVETYEEIRKRAGENIRSMNAEALWLIKTALEAIAEKERQEQEENSQHPTTAPETEDHPNH